MKHDPIPDDVTDIASPAAKDPAADTQSPEGGFARARETLGIRTTFPDDVLREAERVASERHPAAGPERADLTEIPFVTIDPPGSRDLDQAVHVERTSTGYRLRYAIADVGYWVDRGGAIEREAWLRGVTYYAPDEREPLYPPALSEGAASLLPDRVRPAVTFDLALDGDARLVTSAIGRTIVRSRAQLTYAQLLAHAVAPERSPLGGEPWGETLTLIGEIGPKLLALEAARGGVSLPVRDQHVQRRAAGLLGFELVYELPNVAEGWNAELSLLAGHVAAERMLASGVGLMRTMTPIVPQAAERLRRVALTLGFDWPPGTSYAEFMHGVDVRHPRIDVLVRQARRLMRGAEYVAFAGAAPEQAAHGALAFTYAHTTAPLRRLADRYVLDLLCELEAGVPSADAAATLAALAPVMNAAGRREGALERAVVDLAETMALRPHVGAVLDAVVIDVARAGVEVQVEEPPVRATIPLGEGPEPELGARVSVRVERADPEDGVARLVFS